MPRRSERRQAVSRLLRYYRQYRLWRLQRQHHLKQRLRQFFRRAGLPDAAGLSDISLSSDTSLGSISDTSSLHEEDSGSETTSSGLENGSDSSWDSWDSDSSGDLVAGLSGEDTDSSGDDADVEDAVDETSDDSMSESGQFSDSDEEPVWEPGSRADRLTREVRAAIEERYRRRYENSRDSLPRGPAQLPHTLSVLKTQRPDLFRQQLRVWPSTFDRVVARIQNNSVFFNNSNNPQLPVETQLAIALYRFGHNGNAASLQDVANWAGVGKGTVLLCTRRVLAAVLERSFMDAAVRLPTRAEKRRAKRWVRKHSCRAWSGGWCLVDGTLIPLYSRPYWYGESYFDRKCNYSLNIQVRVFQSIGVSSSLTLLP